MHGSFDVGQDQDLSSGAYTVISDDSDNARNRRTTRRPPSDTLAVCICVIGVVAYVSAILWTTLSMVDLKVNPDTSSDTNASGVAPATTNQLLAIAEVVLWVYIPVLCIVAAKWAAVICQQPHVQKCHRNMFAGSIGVWFTALLVFGAELTVRACTAGGALPCASLRLDGVVFILVALMGLEWLQTTYAAACFAAEVRQVHSSDQTLRDSNLTV
jgi:hypothetical protein